MSNEAMTTEELKAMEEAMAAFLEEFRNPSRCGKGSESRKVHYYHLS